MNEATFIAYRASTGKLEDVRYVKGESVTMSLTGGEEHHIYCLANMGDIRKSAPLLESGMEDLSYRINSFSDIAGTGIPMAGMAVTQGAAAIPLRRLFAKLILTLDRRGLQAGGSTAPLVSGRFSVMQAARRLYPFAAGGSRASSSNDLFIWEADSQSLDDSAIGDISHETVLYVPENIQGAILQENSNPYDKSYSNQELRNSGKAELCTYLRFNVTKDAAGDGVGGALQYRFYPGSDPTGNFNLEGGKTYRISLVLSWNGMFIDGNWKVYRSGWQDSRMLRVSSSPENGYAASISLQIAEGGAAVPFFVYFSPQGEAFSADSPHHFPAGWNYAIQGREADDLWADLCRDDDLSVSFEYDDAFRSCYLASVPAGSGLAGTTRQVSVFTPERRHSATVTFNIVNAAIQLDKYEVVRRYYEWGTDHAFTVSVIGGSVPFGGISAISDNTDLSVSYDSQSGTATMYWTSANVSSLRRRAAVTFSGSGGSATCVIWQDTMSSFSIEDDEDGGEGDNNYD